MKKNLQFIVISLCTVVFIFGIFFEPTASAQGISNGLLLCVRVIIPSLFPFLAAACFISRSQLSEKIGRLFTVPSRILFRMPECAASAIFMGMIGGYPVGSKMTADLYLQKKITAPQAHRLLLFCVNPDSAFAINAVGTAVLGSCESGLVLFSALILSSLLIGFFSRIFFKDEACFNSVPTADLKINWADAYVEAVADASGSMYGICAWVVLFSCFISLMQSAPLPEKAQSLVACVMECSAGTSMLKSRNLPLIAAVLAWGGLSVHCQALPYILKTDMNPLAFFGGRILHALTAFFCANGILFFFPQPVQAFASTVSTAPQAACTSVPAAVALIFMSGLLILDIDKKAKI